MSVTTTERGTVKSWLPDRGFGFIKPDQPHSSDVFVHVTTLEAAGIHDLERGQRVEYQAVEDRKGLRAVQVRVV